MPYTGGTEKNPTPRLSSHHTLPCHRTSHLQQRQLIETYAVLNYGFVRVIYLKNHHPTRGTPSHRNGIGGQEKEAPKGSMCACGVWGPEMVAKCEKSPRIVILRSIRQDYVTAWPRELVVRPPILCAHPATTSKALRDGLNGQMRRQSVEKHFAFRVHLTQPYTPSLSLPLSLPVRSVSVPLPSTTESDRVIVD